MIQRLVLSLKFLLLSALLLLLGEIGGMLQPALAPAASSRAGPPPQAAAGSTPDEDCALCHEEISESFSRNAHVVLQKSPRYRLENSCESCHGPGSAHVDSDGDPGKILGFGGSDVSTANRQCLVCHESGRSLSGFGGGHHARAGLSCADCHGIHSPAPASAQLKQPSVALCLDCHRENRSDFTKPFHHRVLEGSMECVDCHQPHGGWEASRLRASFGDPQSCVSCHKQLAGPFVFEHAALELRGCEACHEPHGSNYPKMLVRSTVRNLCLECHSGSRNILSSQTPSFHDVRSPRFQHCTTCHVAIHGSNASRLYLR